jgi:hypothetical protein
MSSDSLVSAAFNSSSAAKSQCGRAWRNGFICPTKRAASANVTSSIPGSAGRLDCPRVPAHDAAQVRYCYGLFFADCLGGVVVYASGTNENLGSFVDILLVFALAALLLTVAIIVADWVADQAGHSAQSSRLFVNHQPNDD